MAGRQDGRIEKGQRIGSAISARAWNRAQDAADVVLGVAPSLMAGPGSMPVSGAVEMLLRNDGTEEIDAYTVVEITGVANQRANASIDANYQKAFDPVPILTGAMPASVSNQNYGVAMHAFGVGEIGRVAIAGVVPCMVNARRSGILNASPATHSFAIASPGVPYLVSSPTGSSRILYGISAGLCMVHLHSGVDYLLAVPSGTWNVNTKQQCRLVTEITLTDGGVDYSYNSGPLVDVWNFLGRVQPNEICIVSRCNTDKLILVQSRGFTPITYNQRVDALNTRVTALENA